MKVAAARWCYFFSQVPGEMHYVPSTTRRITGGASNPGWGRKTQGSLVVKIVRLKSKADNVIAEVPVFGSIGAVDRLIAGRADAVRYRNGDAEIVFDWKSDVDPKADDRATYAHQLAQYVHVLRAKRGAIVYMTTGEIQWVEPARASPT